MVERELDDAAKQILPVGFFEISGPQQKMQFDADGQADIGVPDQADRYCFRLWCAVIDAVELPAGDELLDPGQVQLFKIIQVMIGKLGRDAVAERQVIRDGGADLKSAGRGGMAAIGCRPACEGARLS